ncbi:MFS transporter [Cellulomonas denverensis]|uniref:MFS transporter n=1 Tax=Cellulomonas denverensis TaxID=264297 RepID=A0A7X6QYQ7_9CELL|nr:MFS transporter [Cellulomonas denverensis]NKY22387.1 MFS transporter [Cellulomonas denverensis]GIG26311.1 MFS transporter [Cellulomonas denverensis]
MHAFTAYSRLFRLTGPLYVLVAFLGRLPMAMAQVGTLMLVFRATGSNEVGGVAAGALAIANAIGAPIAGVLCDRHGQRIVVLVQSLAGTAGLIGLVLLAQAGAPNPAMIAMSAALGAVLPQVGPLARVRWRPLAATSGDQRRLVDAAFSYEGAADEASFALGPALVGIAAVLVSPAGALLTAAALLAVFGTAFALHPTARLTGPAAHAVNTVPASPADHAVPALDGRFLTLGLVVLIAAQWSVGVLFGATQTGTNALADAVGKPGLTGLVHAMLGVSSALAGFATALIPARVPHQRRMLVAAVAMVALSWPLLLVDSLGPLTGSVTLLGFAIAPFMIAVYSQAERAVPPARSAAAMTLLAGATSIGYASGAALAGSLADSSGHTAAFGVTVGATVLALLLALTRQRGVHRS